MFKLNMAVIRQNARDSRLTANQANLAKAVTEFVDWKKVNKPLADLAVSQQSEFISELNDFTSLRLMSELLESAMRCCDHHQDNLQARADMNLQCRETPSHLAEDLLNYFNQTYGVNK
jgi:hypothetical protein